MYIRRLQPIPMYTADENIQTWLEGGCNICTVQWRDKRNTFTAGQHVALKHAYEWPVSTYLDILNHILDSVNKTYNRVCLKSAGICKYKDRNWNIMPWIFHIKWQKRANHLCPEKVWSVTFNSYQLPLTYMISNRSDIGIYLMAAEMIKSNHFRSF